MVALVFFATAINYLDRQTLSVVAPVLIAAPSRDHFTLSHFHEVSRVAGSKGHSTLSMSFGRSWISDLRPYKGYRSHLQPNDVEPWTILASSVFAT
jgi:hypothetical protein